MGDLIPSVLFFVDQISAVERHPDVYLSPSLFGYGLSHEKTKYGPVGVVAARGDDKHIFPLLVYIRECLSAHHRIQSCDSQARSQHFQEISFAGSFTAPDNLDLLLFIPRFPP